MTDRQVLTLREVAQYLNAHPNTIYRMAQKAQIPAFKLGRDWRFNRESIDAWRLSAEVRHKGEHQTLPPLELNREVLDVVTWYRSEAGQPSVTENEIALFLCAEEEALHWTLDRLVKTGLLARTDRGIRYRLTHAGVLQAKRWSPIAESLAGHASVLELDVRRQELSTSADKDDNQSQGDEKLWIP